MNNKSLLRNFLHYVYLNVLGMVAVSCFILADTYFVAKAMGAYGIAGLNISLSLVSLMMGFGLMMGIGGATRYAILASAGNKEEANQTFFHSVMLGLIGGVLFFLVGIFFARPLATFLGADAVTEPYTVSYLSVILAFSPMFIMNNIILTFVRNDHNPKLAMTAMIVSSFSNIILDYIFIFILELGIKGAAIATGLSPVISLMVLSKHFFHYKNTLVLKRCKIELRRLLDIMKLGLSAFTVETASAVVLITFNRIILGIEGNIGVATYGIIANLALVATAVFTGIGQGMQPLISQAHGMNERIGARKVLKYGLVTSTFSALIIYGGIWHNSDIIIKLFNSESNNHLTMLAKEGLSIYFLGFFFAGVNIILTSFLSSSERAGLGFFISIMRSVIVMIPAVLILSSLYGMTGVWISFVLAELIVLVIGVNSMVLSEKLHLKNHSLAMYGE